MRSWQVGDVKITQVIEMPVEAGTLDGLIEEATPEAVQAISWLYPDYANAEGQTLWSLHSYIVDTGSSVIVVDTCCGNGKSAPLIPAWAHLDTAFLERFGQAGYDREKVDFVLSTHLHLDHVGWNTMAEGGEFVPTFPNARYVYIQDEFDYHKGIADGAQISTDLAGAVVYEGANPDIHQQTQLVFAESIQPCIDAGLVDLVPTGHPVTESVRYFSTPGHTKWHHSVLIESAGERAFITGDFIHHPAQIAHPAWKSHGDFDRPLSAARREEFVEANADTDLLILGTHFAGTSAGRIVRDADGYRLESI
ncbi:MBL fold metallo-hydrolase [Subtercola frigoramans]|uniref:Glyoxylase-like metal-dependent hydrolase (Beta-lactamase superfamily II) n=1 Tax=Subtercola frigoramans TaxID=120298 RepID=A0ABS2L710_9MICO|nr:MBL fold metallo-hydrolase [Subtercola frigoramans]MBM7472883.1 glyoxylase-like metal-dependent hydrolase (beta-lactamase superfamily II) [Subtercola frigoramans]